MRTGNWGLELGTRDWDLELRMGGRDWGLGTRDCEWEVGVEDGG